MPQFKVLIRSNFLIYLFSFYCATLGITYAKVLIITQNYNRPEFINLQIQCFNRFLEDDFEYVVFNDATEQYMADKISSICQENLIKCIRIPQDERPIAPQICEGKVSWASIRHAQALQFSIKHLAAMHNDLVMLIDNDIFLLKRFNIRKFLGNADIGGLRQTPGNIEYLWANLLLFNMPTLPNKDSLQFFPLYINNVTLDTGGSLHSYLTSNPQVKVLYFKQDGRFCLDHNLIPYKLINTSTDNGRNPILCRKCKQKKLKCSHSDKILREMKFDSRIVKYVQSKTLPRDCEFILGDTFFHYRRGSWGNREQDSQKIQNLTIFLTDFLTA